MLDSNLLAFFIADATDGTKHHSTFFQTRADSEPEPAYSLRHPDPASPNAKNCYAAALFDAYAADILYGEVLIHPKWTHPTLNQDEIRRNGGVSPPPEPIMPNDFTIQLYNPDQQIHVTQRSGQLLGSTRWEFSMPQDTFRAPSSSMLDKSQNDPGVSLTTPRINFVWRKESKFTKDITCFVTGKSTDVQTKKKSKEPDIAVALFKGLKEITVYEPNLYRVDMEDPKGLEVTLLLSAAVLREVFFGNVKQVFNVSDAARRASGGTAAVGAPINGSAAAAAGLYTRPHSQSLSGATLGPPNSTINRTNTSPHSPITDARTQWEIDAETARLKAQVDAEERERRRQEEVRRRERERADAEETKRLRKMVEQEERELKAQQKKIDKETERLRKLHGPQATPQSVASDHAAAMSSAMAFSPGFSAASSVPPPAQSQSAPPPHPQPFPIRPPTDYYGYHPPPQPAAMQGFYQQPSQHMQPGPYQQPHGASVSTGSLNPSNTAPKRKSFLNLRNFINGDDQNR